MIATTSTDEKAELARGAGADETIGYEGFGERARELRRRGVTRSTTAIGATTFDEALAALRPRGYHGPLRHGERAAAAVDDRRSCRRSRCSSRARRSPTTPRRRGAAPRAGDVLGWIAAGALDVRIGERYPLEDARARRPTSSRALDREADPHAVDSRSWCCGRSSPLELAGLVVLGVQRSVSERRGGEAWLIAALTPALDAALEAGEGARPRRPGAAARRAADPPPRPPSRDRLRARAVGAGAAAVIVSDLDVGDVLLAFAVATLAGMDVASWSP